jgi:hypothetical protein
MRFRAALSIATLFLFCFTVAVWAAPLESAIDSEEGKLSGRITSVGDAEFVVEVRRDEGLARIRFVLDSNSKVDGKLSIGSQATVEYRFEGRSKVADRVSVLPGSGFQSY